MKKPAHLVATTTPFSSWAFAAKLPIRHDPARQRARISLYALSPVLELTVRTLHIQPVEFFSDARGTLIHGARRQIETQKKKQSSPHTPSPPRYPIPCPSPLTLLTSPKMTINLAPSRRSPLLSYNGSGSRKPCYSAVFLIANARLRLRLRHRKLSPLKFPNRERMAILHPVSEAQRCLASRQLSRRTHRRRFANRPPCRRFTKPGFLIVTKRSFSIRPDASGSPRPFRPPNFNLGQRNELRLKWHRHSCLCSDDHQPTTTNPHPRPHFTFTSTQPAPRLQSNFREQADAG